ncbi:MAG TPA: ribonuclease P protein component [Candidatus Saccharimonadia bacterium]|nr:ribonuclease P protein component [Candidatus Saccharimonadia bacterium]
MLAAHYRLRKPHEISRVYKRGVYGGAEGLLSVKAATSGRPEARAVVVVSKKVDKRAVVRNRIRRRLAASLHEMWATVPAGYDIVVSVHSDISGLPTPKLRELLQQALRRARVLTA